MAKSKEMANFDPHSSETAGSILMKFDFDEIRTLELPPKEPQPCKILFWSDDVGGLGEYPVCHCHWKYNFYGSCFHR